MFWKATSRCNTNIFWGIRLEYVSDDLKQQPRKNPHSIHKLMCWNFVVTLCFWCFFLNHKGFFCFPFISFTLKIHRLPGGEGGDGTWSGWQLMQRSRAVVRDMLGVIIYPEQRWLSPIFPNGVSCKSWWIAYNSAQVAVFFSAWYTRYILPWGLKIPTTYEQN